MPQAVPHAARLASALEHLATINYTVPELLVELLGTNNALIVPARDELRAQRREILRALLYETQTPFDGALRASELLGLSIGDLLRDLSHCTAPEVSAAVDLALPAFLKSALGAHSAVVSKFALNATASRYAEEMLKISRKSAGFHGGVSGVQPADLEGFDLSSVALRLREQAPLLWDLFLRLTDARDQHSDSASVGARVPVFLVGPGDLGAHDDAVLLNGDEDEPVAGVQVVDPGAQRDDDAEDAMDVDLPSVVRSQRASRAARTVRALRRYTALSEMKIVTIFGIMQQATNQKCNILQLHMGSFLRMTHVPDSVVNVLNHIGITISNSSMNGAVDALSKASAKGLLAQGATKTSQKAFDNYDFKHGVAQPTVTHDKKMQSAISALNISSHPSLTPEHFRFVDIAWQTNEAIRLPRDPSHRRPYKVSYLEVLQLSATLDSRPPPLPNALPYHISTNAWYARQILTQRQRFSRFAQFLGEPEAVERIPPHKTEWDPLVAMDLKQSSVNDTIVALENIFAQTGITDEIADEYVTFVHGDLGGSERVLSAQLFRSCDLTSTTQLKSIVDVPGLFHALMASEDAIFRLHVLPSDARFNVAPDSKQSNIYNYIRQLLPKEYNKFASSSPGPTFRRAHDTFTHIFWALILECWGLEAAAWSAGCTNLDRFASALDELPDAVAWRVIEELSVKIATNYVAGPDFHKERSRPLAERDQNLENTKLYLAHMFVHTDLNYSIKIQDVGRVVQAMCVLIFIYAAARKHKYSTHTLRILVNLAYNWPPLLKEAFLTSWIINPSGKPHGGRGVDWLVELYNLYIKVVHSGSSSNFGMEQMVKVSPLIKLYKIVFNDFVVNYYMLGRTVKHAAADMTDTVDVLRNRIRADEALVFTAGRTVPYEVPDAVAVGQHMFQTRKAVDVDGADDEEREVIDIEDFFL